MIESLSIQNYRGIKELEITGLKNISLISGLNNIGKTTLLESVLLLYNYRYAPNLLYPLLRKTSAFWNRIPVKFEDVLYGLFYNNDYSNKLIKISTNDVELVITYIEEHEYIIQQSTPPVPLTVTSPALGFETKRLGAVVSSAKSVSYSMSNSVYAVIENQVNDLHSLLPEVIMINDQGKITKATDLYSNIPHSTSLVTEYNKIRIDEGKKQLLIGALKIIDARISDIELGLSTDANGQHQETRIEIKKDNVLGLIPLSSLGHGINRVFNIVISLINHPNSIILIDEIENGIHYSIMEKLWELIYKISTENNNQIIAVTHSLEFARYARKINFLSDETFSYVRLLEDDVVATLSYESFKRLVDKDLEVR